MPRFPFPRLNAGLNSLVNPLVGDPAQAADVQDGLFQHGLLEQRFGYDVLALEPSHWSDVNHTEKGLCFLDFDAVNDYATNAAWTQTLGTKWTILSTLNPFNSIASGTVLVIKAATNDPVSVNLVWDGGASTIAIQVVVKDVLGNSVTITSPARNVGQWATVGANSSSLFWRIVRDGATVSLYIGDQATAQASSSSFTANIHEIGTAIFLGAASAAAGFVRLGASRSLVVVNRVMAEEECYFPIDWPTDETPEGDVLGNWLFNAATGTTITDLSSAGLNLTVSGATWNGAASIGARGLGIHTHRRYDGSRYYVFACGRRGTGPGTTATTGGLTIWKANKSFTPFHVGGDPRNYDATVTLDGFDARARFSFVSVGDELYAANGVDYARCYGGRTPALTYWGLTAPAAAPVLSKAATGGGVGAGVYGYCYTYFNPNTGVESGRSPIAQITTTALDTVTVACFGSSDTQAVYVRVYRTQVGGSVFTLCSQGEVLVGTPTYTDTFTDAAILGNAPLPGDDEARSANRKRLYLQGGSGVVPTMAAVTAGGSVDNGLHYYAQSWYNPTTGVETGFSPIVAATTGGGNNTVPLTAMSLPDSGLSGFTQMRIYRTKAGGFLWFLVNTVAAAATYTDAAADASLTATIETRALPPKCRFACLFSNRLITAGNPDAPSTVYVSYAGDYQNFPWLGHDFIPHPGAEVTALRATERFLIISYGDGKVIRVPTMPTDADLPLFLLTTPSEWAPKGACVAQHSIQETPLGLVWLGRDGFYLANDEGIGLLSGSIDPSLLNLNRVRARYACSVYMEDEGIYICWISTGTQRLNEQAYVLDLKTAGFPWTVWNVAADAAGVYTDASEIPHYCFLEDQGRLNEFDKASAYDGDAGGTLSETMTFVGIASFFPISGRVAPTGGDGGSFYAVKSDGTVVRRRVLDPVMGGAAINRAYFYPSASALLSGTWTAYYNGIRLLWASMKSNLGDRRPDKTIQSVFITHATEAAGGLGVEYALDNGAFVAVGADPSLTDPMTSQASIQKAARYVQVRLSHKPPVAGETMKVVGIEVEYAVAGDTRG